MTNHTLMSPSYGLIEFSPYIRLWNSYEPLSILSITRSVLLIVDLSLFCRLVQVTHHSSRHNVITSQSTTLFHTFLRKPISFGPRAIPGNERRLSVSSGTFRSAHLPSLCSVSDGTKRWWTS